MPHGQNAKTIKQYCRLPWWLSGKQSTCQYRRHRFDPWSMKIPHTAEQLSQWAMTDKKCWNFCQAGKELRWVETPLFLISFLASWPSSSHDAVVLLWRKQQRHWESPAFLLLKCPPYLYFDRDQDSMEKAWNNQKREKDCSKLGEKCLHQQLVAGRKTRR